MPVALIYYVSICQENATNDRIGFYVFKLCRVSDKTVTWNKKTHYPRRLANNGNIWRTPPSLSRSATAFCLFSSHKQLDRLRRIEPIIFISRFQTVGKKYVAFTRKCSCRDTNQYLKSILNNLWAKDWETYFFALCFVRYLLFTWTGSFDMVFIMFL